MIQLAAFFDTLFWLSLALLAITVTGYAIAVSNLGRAVELAGEGKKNAIEKARHELEERKAELTAQVTKLQEQLKQPGVDAKKVGSQLMEIEKTAGKIDKAIRRGEHDIKRIERKPLILTVKGSVLAPAILFLAAAFGANAGKAANTAGATGLVASPLFSFVILAAVASGPYLLYGTLKAVEEVAVKGEEAQYRRMIAVLKKAMREMEEEMRPVLQLEWFSPEAPPFELKRGKEQAIAFRVKVSRPASANDVSAVFLFPQALEFPGTSLPVPYPSGIIVVGHREVVAHIGTLVQDERRLCVIRIKAPNEVTPGEFDCYYSLRCPGLSTDPVKFIVKVT